MLLVNSDGTVEHGLGAWSLGWLVIPSPAASPSQIILVYSFPWFSAPQTLSSLFTTFCLRWGLGHVGGLGLSVGPWGTPTSVLDWPSPCALHGWLNEGGSTPDPGTHIACPGMGVAITLKLVPCHELRSRAHAKGRYLAPPHHPSWSRAWWYGRWWDI